ncbi:MAG: ketopantoate reductase family protein [Defluviitaleaceae bacterium]|nr:ketopantoate reductase family protein [Defluviitaleaceae bacterium]
MKQERVAIIGAGSLGTVMAAIVAQNGGKCILIDTNKEHVDALNKNGATVTGYMDIKNIPVEAITPDQMSGIYDIAIILTKQLVNKIVLTNLLKYIDDNSVVCTLQNGVPEEFVAEIVGKNRTCGGAVGWGATWVAPGISQLNTTPEHVIVEIGNLDNVVDDNLKRVEAFLKLAGGVVINTNLSGFRWSKLWMNAAVSGMSAATGSTFGEVMDNENAVACAAHVANELIQVATAKGITLEEIIPGKDFYDARFDDKAGRERAIATLRDVYSVHRPSKASMLQDMEKNIPCEIDYINGVVCDGGDETGIDTPFNDIIRDIIKEFEAGGRPLPTMANVKRFNIPAL